MKNKNLLDNLYILSDNGEYSTFNTEYMNSDNREKYAIYNIVSDVQRDSGLSFNFSYEIGSLAVAVLRDNDNWLDGDMITEAVDQIVPVYTSEIMKIYKEDSSTVDEACDEFSTDVEDKITSEQRAQRGWYFAISNMVHELINKLSDNNE